MQRRAVTSDTTDSTALKSQTSRSLSDTNVRRRRKRRSSAFRSHYSSRLSEVAEIAIIVAAAVLLVLLAAIVLYKVCHSVPDWYKTRVKGRKSLPDNGGATVDELEILPWNRIYRVKDAMTVVGDRSNHYAHLRQETDPLLEDPNRVSDLLSQVHSRQLSYIPRTMEVHHSDQVPYDIYDCPANPPAGYPYTWKTIDILRAWPADYTVPPTTRSDPATGKTNGLIHQSLCVFDYQKDHDKAITYRDASLPFIVVNDPAVAKTVARWSLPGYMEQLLGPVKHRTEYSPNNHFMYYVPVPKKLRKDPARMRRNRLKVPEGWTEPTQMMRMSYAEWLHHANVTDDRLTRDHPHWYYRLIGCGLQGNDGSCDSGSSEYLYDELPFFQPKPNLYIVDPNEQKGIHCRFGMKGVIAENHFDSSRNAIALLSGSRRYILAHPDQCSNLALYPKGHPSARHSAVDWSNPDLDEFPEFAQAVGNEVVLQPGQVLYLPTNWFHFIVSLELNMQCNTRSGIEADMMTHVRNCGF